MKNETRTMHLFAGHGGGLLADLILGHTPVFAVEWDRYACQVLRERAADGWFPSLRVWEGDVRLFDPSEYAGKVDCIHAGFPCQDISTAGKQAGVGEGTRSGLYREDLRIAGIVRPRELFLENVAAIKSNGLETVLKDLALLGYDCRWLCIRASDVGAPHHRDRWFALCHANTDSSNGSAEQAIEQQRTKEFSGDCKGSMGSLLANSDMQHGEWWPKSQKSSSDCGETWAKPFGVCTNVAHTNGTQGQRNECTKRIKSKYSDISGAGWWSVEPNVGRVANGIPNRVYRLKGLGNAQVPIQAAIAYRLLAGASPV